MDTDRPGQAITVQPWHAAVADHHIEMPFQPQPQRLRPVLRDPGMMPEIIELLSQQQAIGRVIINHQHAQSHFAGLET